MAYQCKECASSFPKLSQLLQHRRVQNHWRKFTCPSCKKTFSRKDNLDRHLKKHADEKNQHCPECLKVFTRKDALDDHLHIKHGWSAAAKRPAELQIGGGAVKRQRLLKSDDPSDFYTLERVSERKIEKFKTKAVYYKIGIKDVEVRDLPNILKTLKTLFNSIIERIAENIPSNDLVRVTIDNPQLDFPIVLPFMRRSEFTVDRLLNEIEKVLQSYEQFVVDETFGIEIVHVNRVSGSGYKMRPVVDVAKMLDCKKSIIQIKNKDQLCCARALVTAMARHEKHPQWDNIRQGRGIQRELALQLHEKAAVPTQICGIEEVKKFQTTLPKYQIHVLSKEHFNGKLYEGPTGGIPIYLYFHDGHFDVITKITGFLNRNYFCQQCKKGYQHKERHSCNNPCHFCHHLHEETQEDWQHCQACNCKFVNGECFLLHLKKSEHGKSTCDIYYRCKQCSQLINRLKHKRPHVCGETFCKTCKDYVDEGHQCYMQPVDNEEDLCQTKRSQKKTKYIFFDLECTQDNQLHCEEGYRSGVNNHCVNCNTSWCGSMQHRPNLCVVHKVCSLCMKSDIKPSSSCEECGTQERVFSGPNTITMFCQWLFSEENRGALVICHNFKGYDSYPVMQYLYDNAILPEVITTGSKFMSISVPMWKIRFIDSLNFIPMALADMPKAFGETEIAKGYFPHIYNRQEHQHSVLDHLPDIKYYNPDGMKPESRSKFLEWYNKHYQDHFDFQKELLIYCRSDVDVLRKCCLKFRSIFLNLTKTKDRDGIDPFEKCITIASACNLVFRTLFLNHETIGIIPPHGYRAEAKQSLMAYQWLSYLAYVRGIHIQHGRNGNEKEIGPYKVDGFYQTDTGDKVALEFNGCFWHGCVKCFSRTTVNPVTELTMKELYDRTVEKKLFLESKGFVYESFWECDFKSELKTNPSMKAFIESLEIITPLEPRDAFYGGRTEAFRLYDEATETKKIKYYDVTSLYPFVNKTGKIPIGHPTIITENFDNLENYEGLIKCKVLPPKGLYTPVLPVKCNGKLLFSLCRACGETYQQSKCKHNTEARSFIGTWVTDELKMAHANGYKLLKVYEVWHFDEMSQYDPSTKTGGLFTEYVNTFLKIKQEASGWPDWCVDEKRKQQYIHQYFMKEGIKLDSDKIQENPGLRLLAKLMLNSFWGKFGQRSNLTKITYFDEPKEFMDMMTSDQQEVKNVRFLNDEAVQVDWVYSSDFIEPSSRTNVVIAAYTTAQARLKLYSYLKPLGDQVMYCDTDSIVFTVKPGEWEPALGDFLGDLTDEAPNNDITHFVTGGPKNYAYNLSEPNKKGQTSICKVRGITLNFKNTLAINFDTLKRLVSCKSAENIITVTDKFKITRNSETCNIVTKLEHKDYRIVFDKRVLTHDYVSIPYGF